MKFYCTIDKVSYLPAFQGPFMWAVTQGLLKRKKMLCEGRQCAIGREWAMDSGGFSELRRYGKYSFTLLEYLDAVKRLRPDLFFTMDWMCEPSVLKTTTYSVRKHLILTCEITNKLLSLIHQVHPRSQFAEVVQGWAVEDYLDHIDMIREWHGFTKILGIGSICRRNSEAEILQIIRAVRRAVPGWVKLHGFGVKISLLKYPYGPQIVEFLDSIDSAAWGWKKGCWEVNTMRKLPFIAQYVNQVNNLINKWNGQLKLEVEGDKKCL